MERGRWFRGGQDVRERPFDWLALALEHGVAAHEARALLDEAVRRASVRRGPRRHQLAIYLELLRAARQQALPWSPGKFTRTMLREAEPGLPHEPHISQLTGQRIAPGRRTLTSYLESEQEPGLPHEPHVSRLTGQRIAPGRRTLTSYLESEQEHPSTHTRTNEDGSAWTWSRAETAMPALMIAAAGLPVGASAKPIPRATLEQVLRPVGGQPLPESIRRTLERRFKVSLTGVRIHTDAAAQAAVSAIGARAFTVGEHIFFAAGHPAFDTSDGMALLVHEITHVVQHHQGRLRPQGDGVHVADPASATEQEATATGGAAAHTAGKSAGDAAQVAEEGSEQRGVMRTELADAAAHDGVMVQRVEGQPTRLAPDEEPETAEAQGRAAETAGGETKPAAPRSGDRDAKSGAATAPAAADIPTSEPATADANGGAASTPPGTVAGAATTPQSDAAGTVADTATTPRGPVQPPHPEMAAVASAVEAEQAQSPSPEAFRGAFPEAPPSFEEFSQTLQSGRTPEQDRADAAQLVASLEAGAQQEQSALQATAVAGKAEIHALAGAQEATIHAALVQQTAAISQSHTTARATLRSSAEQRKAEITSEVAAETAQVHASTAAAVAEADAQLEQRRSGFVAFIASHRQSAQSVVESESRRASGELDAAADEAIAVGEAEARRRTSSDAQNAARRLAAESAADIRAKKGDIASDLRARFGELSGKFDEYEQKITGQIAEVRAQLIPAMEARAPRVIADLEQGKTAAAGSIDRAVAQREQELRTAENAAVASLERAGQAALSQVRSTSSQLSRGIDTLVRAIGTQQQQLATSMAAAIRKEQEPNMPGVREAVAGARAQLAALSTTGRDQLGGLRASASGSLVQIAARFTERAGTLVAEGRQQATTCVIGAQTTLEETATQRREAAQARIDELASTHGEMVSSTLAELEPAIGAARGEVEERSQQFRDEVTQATDQSITEAKKPRTDPLESRAAEAADQAEESWLSGLLRAIGDIVVGLVIVVVLALVVAAVAAAFGVLLTAWAAMMIAGAILLVIGLAAALYTRWNQPELADSPWWQRVGLAVMDTTGITGIVQAFTGHDIVTGAELSAGQRTHQGVTGTFSLVMLILGARAAFRGPPGGLWTRNPGSPIGWVGWRNAIPEAMRGMRNVAVELYTGLVESGRRGVEWLRGRFGQRTNAPNEPPLPERPQRQPNETNESYMQRLRQWRAQQVGSEQYQRYFNEQTVNNAANKIQDPANQRWWNTATLRERQLAYDTAHEGQITDQGVREARIGLAAEREGLVEPPLRRSTNPGEEFVDGRGQAWDVKRPDSPASLARDLIAGENILVEGELSPAQYEALLRDVGGILTAEGRGDIVANLGARVRVLQHGYTAPPPVQPGQSDEQHSQGTGNGP
jgi:hypothetical protein